MKSTGSAFLVSDEVVHEDGSEPSDEERIEVRKARAGPGERYEVVWHDERPLRHRALAKMFDPRARIEASQSSKEDQ